MSSLFDNAILQAPVFEYLFVPALSSWPVHKRLAQLSYLGMYSAKWICKKTRVAQSLHWHTLYANKSLRFKEDVQALENVGGSDKL